MTRLESERTVSCASKRHFNLNVLSAITFGLMTSCVIVLASMDCKTAQAQDLSWVKAAMERSKHATRESVPLWQHDPRIAAGNADASLHAITSASADRVWAVGARGLIVASQNGGRTWSQQPSGTTLNLYAVAFANERQGFIVGGTIQPMSRTSLGIVLATDDAGQSWRSVSSGSLPRLTGLMVSANGVLTAWGDYSPLHGSAIVESRDYGQSWLPIPSPLGHLQTVARQVGGLQFGIDRAGRISQLPARMDGVLSQLASPSLPINAMTHTGSQWIAIGDGGTLAASADGLRWVDRPLPLSPPARAVCNLRCVTSFEQHVWAAGQPGSVLLHSDNYGDTWQIQPSDQSWSINAIHFFDQHRGWAVTDAGSILATRDAGKSWFAQRNPIKRLGLQAFAALPTQVSWPALAESAWQSRQATALSVHHRENMEDAVDFLPDMPATLATIGSQAALVSAAQSSKHPLADFRVRDLRQLASRTIADNSSTSGTASQGLASGPDHGSEMVVQLRAGRPTVIVVDDFHSGDSSALTEAVVAALQQAGSRDPSLTWLERELFLPPWQVSKLFAFSPANQAEFTIAADQMLGDSGLSVIDALAPVHGFDARVRANASLRCLQVGSPSLSARTSLFHPNDRHPDSSRPIDLVKVGNLQLVMGRVHRDKAWQALAPSPLRADEDLSIWLRKLESVIEKTPRHEIGPALVELAVANLHAAAWERWHAALERARGHAPLSDTSRWSAIQQLAFGASDERLAWQRSLQTQPQSDSAGGQYDLTADAKSLQELTTTPVQTPFENDLPVITASATARSTGAADVITASGVQALANERALADEGVDASQRTRHAWLRRAVREYAEVSAADLGLARRPDIQLAHFAHRRGLAEVAGEPAPDPAVLQALASAAPLPGWQQVAEQELLLAGGARSLPNWTARARSTSERPRLDGVADEQFWLQAVPILLSSPFDSQSALRASTAQFAYDDEYLYVLLKCPAGDRTAIIQPQREPRKYDMTLAGTDYLQLSLDTDRDYASSCEMAVNSAGHTSDRCCEAKEWNPRWYVFVDNGDQGWTAELAIKLADLTTASSLTGRAWAISAFRYIPQHDVQSWSQLRSSNPRPQGSGLLLFDP